MRKIGNVKLLKYFIKNTYQYQNQYQFQLTFFLNMKKRYYFKDDCLPSNEFFYYCEKC